MHPTEQLAIILPTLNDLVDGIDPADLDGPTPCEQFALRDVLDHMIVLGGSFACLYRGEQPPPPSVRPKRTEVPRAEFRTTMDDLLGAVRSDGALDRTIVSPVGPMPGETFARLVAFDGLVHGWDIARSTAQPYDPPADLVGAVDAFARAAITDEMRDGDTFKDPTTPPPTATPIERVAAFSGRTV